jgi:hypothetical protein
MSAQVAFFEEASQAAAAADADADAEEDAPDMMQGQGVHTIAKRKP